MKREEPPAGERAQPAEQDGSQGWERSKAKIMQALVYTDWDQLEVREVPEPARGPEEAVIRVAACGICGSELGAFAHRSPRRTPPLVMGHEFSGDDTRISVSGSANLARLPRSLDRRWHY